MTTALTLDPLDPDPEVEQLLREQADADHAPCLAAGKHTFFSTRHSAAACRVLDVVAAPDDDAGRDTKPACSCAKHSDGSVTVLLCPRHADTDPCLTMSRVTGRRRTGTIRRGVCTSCGWTAPAPLTDQG